MIGKRKKKKNCFGGFQKSFIVVKENPSKGVKKS